MILFVFVYLLFFREDPIELEAGSQHIVRYKAIAAFVENGQVSLI